MRALDAILGLIATLVAPLGPQAHAQTVWRVDASGAGDFTSLQEGVDAAVPEDVLLVGAGRYRGFVVDGKGLWIVALPPAGVEIGGQVVVRNVPADQDVVLIGLRGEAEAGAPPAVVPQPGLWMHDNAGHLRVLFCEFRGSAGLYLDFDSNGGPGAVLENDAGIVIDHSSFRGGSGGVTVDALRADGGEGVRITSSFVAVYSTGFRGGDGADSDLQIPPRGGAGCALATSGMYAAGSSFRGGQGGLAYSPLMNDPEGGPGGDGLSIGTGSGCVSQESTFEGGPGGVDWHYYSIPGPSGCDSCGGGILQVLPGAARTIAGARLASDASSMDLEIRGEPGDQVWLASSRRPELRFFPSGAGMLLVSKPRSQALVALGTIPASGTMTASAPLPDLGPGAQGGSRWMQVIARTSAGQTVLGAPHDVFVANCETLSPDCNGNGDWDGCDVLRGLEADCDGNLVPDACQPDCDGNGVADACEILAGAPDLNLNSVPDPCEPRHVIRYVDAAAPLGGDGSVAAPLRTIREAIRMSLDGDEVVVRDGVYVGQGNRNLDISDRAIVLRSEHGPASCIIDLQRRGRAISILQFERERDTRIEGFTFLNGGFELADFDEIVHWGTSGGIQVSSSSPTIVNCRFVSCFGNVGGALALDFSGSVVRDCVFLDNRTLYDVNSASGGAVSIVLGSGRGPRFVGCEFRGNRALRSGGGIFIGGPPSARVLVSHCRFSNNEAGESGGAMCVFGPASIESCSFESNRALDGGGLAVGRLVDLEGCTIVGNTALNSGGALSSSYAVDLTLGNCIVWANSALSGPQLFLHGTGPASVAFCDIQGGEAGVDLARPASLRWGRGNIDLDPRFVDPDGPDDDPTTTFDNDWRLGPGSPCVDAGSNALVPPDRFDLDGDLDRLEPVPFDLLFQPRFRDDPAAPDTGSGTPPLVDMGAFERQP